MSDLDARKAASTGQLLLKAARLYNELAIAAVQRAGHPEIRASHLSLVPHLDLAGTRLTTLAERAGISKQAAGQIVTELEELGYLSRAPDPTDGRAKVLRFTEKGLASMFDGLAALDAVGVELRRRAGEGPVDGLHASLGPVLAALEGMLAAGHG
jgi:DNA-binding MarR family transcriptional regulator